MYIVQEALPSTFIQLYSKVERFLIPNYKCFVELGFQELNGIKIKLIWEFLPNTESSHLNIKSPINIFQINDNYQFLNKLSYLKLISEILEFTKDV